MTNISVNEHYEQLGLSNWRGEKKRERELDTIGKMRGKGRQRSIVKKARDEKYSYKQLYLIIYLLVL